MKTWKKGILSGLIVLIVMIVGCSSGTSNSKKATESEVSKEGDVLRVAINASPPTLDQPMDTATATRDTGRLIFETLVTTNEAYQVVPMLAESIETEDNQTFTFNLRKGITFHNGKEMVAEDVVASMYRWLEKSSITGEIFNEATFEAEDNYTVILKLTQPSTLALDTMASAKQAAAIMPKEIVEAAPPEGVREYIGTGPFKFAEWKQDQYIHFT